MVERILQILAQKGSNAAKMTKELGISSTTLTDWKTSQGNYNAGTVAKIAQYLGVSIEYLLTGTERPASGSGNGLIDSISEILNVLPEEELELAKEHLLYLEDRAKKRKT